MSEDETKPVHPSTTLEERMGTASEQKEQLLAKPAPPSYDQATAGDPPTPQPIPATTASPGDPHVVIVTHPVASPYGPNPIDVLCPSCHNYCRTRVRSTPTSRTHLIALALCLFQLYCCVCVPYCISSCMNTNHYCGMCDQYLGTYQR